MCAARGWLPSQSSGRIRFAQAPGRLWLDGSHGSPYRWNARFASCSGYHHAKCDPATHYANDDVFFLEVCVFNRICRNAAELSRLNRSTDFACEFSAEGLRELRSVLLSS